MGAVNTLFVEELVGGLGDVQAAQMVVTKTATHRNFRLKEWINNVLTEDSSPSNPLAT